MCYVRKNSTRNPRPLIDIKRFRCHTKKSVTSIQISIKKEAKKTLYLQI